MFRSGNRGQKLAEKEKEIESAAKDAEETKKALEKVLARQEIMEYNNQSLSKLMLQFMDRLEGLVNGTIAKGTGMDVMKICLMSEEPIKELAPGKNIREYRLRHHDNDSSS